MPAPFAYIPRETQVPGLPPQLDTAGWPLRTHLALRPLPTAAPCARLHAHHVMREWGLTDLTESVELIVSELVTNAVAAAQPAHTVEPVGLWLHCDGKRVVILVSDGNPDPPVRMNPGADTEAGRGLMLVDAVSAQWDWYPVPDGKVVWALCDGPPARSMGT
jgi:anti-sigma regulatory factor (Ser/Thr protein kinase)